jgi:hypothetical protein
MSTFTSYSLTFRGRAHDEILLRSQGKNNENNCRMRENCYNRCFNSALRHLNAFFHPHAPFEVGSK